MNPKQITKSLTVAKELTDDLKARHENGENGFWMFATREIVDSTGDIVRVDGVDFGLYHQPPDSRLKILAQHIRALPNGEAPVVAVLEEAVKTVVPYKGKMVKALALYCTWLRDGEGKLLPLSQHYYDLMNAKPYAGIDSGSVGLMVDEYSELKETGGLDITKSTIFEFSLVTVPANAGATAIKELEAKLGVEIDKEALATPEEEKEAVKENPVEEPVGKSLTVEDLVSVLEPMVKSISELSTALKSYTERLDVMESAIVVLTDVAKAQTSVPPQDGPAPEQTKKFLDTLNRLNKFLDK